MNLEQKAAYLAALTDGEGHIRFQRKYYGRDIRIVNTDQDILVACSNFLCDLGIPHNQYAMTAKNCYVIIVSGRKNLQRFYELVPLQSSKRNRLKEVLDSFKEIKDELRAAA